MKLFIFIFFYLFLFFSGTNAWAQCQVFNSNGTLASAQDDLLYQNLNILSGCPQNVFELKSVLSNDGVTMLPSMVANRGRHNPRFGSFSLFETATGFSQALGKNIGKGEFFFGHFTGAAGGQVLLDQAPAPRKLLVELIAWDDSKKMYNFYELIGTQTGGRWFYRGDSKTALEDNQKLHLPAAAERGEMRCSACHNSGGPIMKELDFPHNDWWTASRPLPFAPNQASSQLIDGWLNHLIDASEFAEHVTAGINKLEASSTYQGLKNQSLTLQEQLRPLFCTTEINLISDKLPLSSPSSNISISSSFWVNPLLGSTSELSVDKNSYVERISSMGLSFPETNRSDADHAFLVPVKGQSDLVAIQSLISSGLITKEFASDVLAVDFTAPLFSQKRCDLLQLLPESRENWEQSFSQNLQNSNLSGASELIENIEDVQKDAFFHQAQASNFIGEIQIGLQNDLLGQMNQMQNIRMSVFTNAISRNPRGQILEPGFRVIFPVSGN